MIVRLHAVHGVLEAGIVKCVVAIAFSSGPHFVKSLSWAALHGMAYSLIELHDAVIPVIILVSFTVTVMFVLETVGL